MRLHLACGPNRFDGWVNIDLNSAAADRLWDLRRPLPYPNQSADAIFCEHFIEHIPRADGVRFLADCHRLLKPNAALRLSTPDLRWLVAKYEGGEINHWADVGWTVRNGCQLLNEGMRLWGHQWVYDAEDLRSALMEAGFRKIEQAAWRISALSDLHELETRPDHHELIFEATRGDEGDINTGPVPFSRRLPGWCERLLRSLLDR